jgi:putative sigma-54 modulation protein
MDLQIRGNGLSVSDDLRRFVEQRVAKLDHLLDRVVDAKLELRARHNRLGPDTTTAQLTIQTGRHLLRAEENDPDPRLAVDRAVDKLTRQVRRFHDKRSRRKASRADLVPLPPSSASDIEDVDIDDGDAGDLPSSVVRTKRFALKPMDVDEAIAQMELLDHDFYLFHNVEEDTVNVLYRRRDGEYGLLAPDRN